MKTKSQIKKRKMKTKSILAPQKFKLKITQ